MADNDDLVDDASLAINEVFRDTSVSPEETKSRLLGLRDEIDVLIAAIEECEGDAE